jgi:hypothetical protein
VKRAAAASKRTTAMTVASHRKSGHAPGPLMKARAGLGGAKDKTARLIAKNPFRVVAGALALGFVFAKLKTIF